MPQVAAEDIDHVAERGTCRYTNGGLLLLLSFHQQYPRRCAFAICLRILRSCVPRLFVCCVYTSSIGFTKRYANGRYGRRFSVSAASPHKIHLGTAFAYFVPRTAISNGSAPTTTQTPYTGGSYTCGTFLEAGSVVLDVPVGNSHSPTTIYGPTHFIYLYPTAGLHVLAGSDTADPHCHSTVSVAPSGRYLTIAVLFTVLTNYHCQFASIRDCRHAASHQNNFESNLHWTFHRLDYECCRFVWSWNVQ